MKKAVVIGAGIGGIAIALRLKALKYQVTVIEKNSKPGGKLDEFNWKGFRWDMGPSLLTLPHMVDELFQIFQTNPTGKFEYNKLDIVCKYFFSDGLILNGFNSKDKFAGEVENKTGIKKEIIYKYLKRSETIYKFTAPVFIFNTFHKFNRERIKNGLKALVNFYKLQAFSTMHRNNRKQLKDPHLVQLFDRFATYNGSNPYKAPATLNVIPYLEHCLGAYFPKNGMYSIVDSLVTLANDAGIEFRLSERVLNIMHAKGKVESVKTNMAEYSADVVVSDSDIVPLYKLFKPKFDIPLKYMKHERSSSALIFYWAMNKTFKQLDLHNIFFSQNYESEFKHLFETKDFFPDPTIYVFISSKLVKNDAPEGKENWFVMINAPANSGQNWDEFINKARNSIIDKLNRTLNCEIREQIIHEEILDPRQIEGKTSSYQGSLYGASSNNKWSAFQRHANFTNKLRGMYFVGGSVHPGGGIPLCLSSAKIVSELICVEERKK